MREILHKFAALIAIATLLAPVISILAESLSAADLPVCCNTTYCPVHHRQAREFQKDKSDCAGLGIPGHNDCSMRACDTAPKPVVGTAAYVMVTPIELRAPSVAEAAPALVSGSLAFLTAIPLTPPPRTFPT
jgi:hypothetical protein